MNTLRMALAAVSLAAVPLVAAMPAAAQTQLVENGDFETGSLAGWTVVTQTGSGVGGFFAASNDAGATTPLSGLDYAANPGGGRFIALSDQGAAGSYALVQRFTIASAGTFDIAFDLFANNYGASIEPGRDVGTGDAQNATVDLLVGTADALTDSGTDIVSVLYGPGADDPATNANPFTRYTLSRALDAGTYQIRFAQTNAQGFLNMGIDNVSITAAVPEPATWAMMLTGFGMVAGAARYRRRKALIVHG